MYSETQESTFNFSSVLQMLLNMPNDPETIILPQVQILCDYRQKYLLKNHL